MLIKQVLKISVTYILIIVTLAGIRAMDEGNEYTPPLKRQKLEDSIFADLNTDMQLLVLRQVENPTTTLRLVCKEFYNFCEGNRLRGWRLTPEAYLSFKEEQYKEWVEVRLGKLSALSFINTIEDSALDDEMFEGEWNKNNVFLSKEDFEYINRKAINLKELRIYNIPCLGEYLNFAPPYAYSLNYFDFNYDHCIFINISFEEFIGCTHFTNLETLNICSDIFSRNGQVNPSFSFLTNLKTLILQSVGTDATWNNAETTNLFKSLTHLKQLNTLVVHFIEAEGLSSLTTLTTLTSLTSLSVRFIDFTEEDDAIIKAAGIREDGLPLLFNSLSSLKSISVDGMANPLKVS